MTKLRRHDIRHNDIRQNNRHETLGIKFCLRVVILSVTFSSNMVSIGMLIVMARVAIMSIMLRVVSAEDRYAAAALK